MSHVTGMGGLGVLVTCGFVCLAWSDGRVSGHGLVTVQGVTVSDIWYKARSEGG